MAAGNNEVIGFGAGRISRQTWKDRFEGERAEALVERSKQMLYRALNLRTTIAFLGAGVAWERFGGWGQLVQSVIEKLREQNSQTVLQDIAAASDARHALFNLQRCHSAWSGKPTFHQFLAERYAPGAQAPIEIITKIVTVPFRRFVTTNYDGEIERALMACDATLPSPPLNSEHVQEHPGFTYLKEYTDRLAQFVLANRRDTAPAVFHLHGWYVEPQSIIATDWDYRHKYLAPDSFEPVMFRQTLDLLLSSNPILFMGYGLAEPDFMRVLEVVRAADEQRADERLLFALVPTFELRSTLVPDGTPLDAALDFFFQRYGVHVIPYQCSCAEEIKTEFPKAIDDVKNGWEDWWRRWLLKPKFRSPARVSGRRLIHPEIHGKPSDLLARHATTRDLNDISRQINEQNCRVIVLLGPGGYGKSLRALQMDEIRAIRREKFVFWSSYYADDWLTGLERMYAFLGLPTRPTRDGTPAIRAVFQSDAMIVFDGFERVLQPLPARRLSQESGGSAAPQCSTRDGISNGVSELGRAYNASVRDLLREMVRSGNRATIVLTTRLLPQELTEGLDGESISLRPGVYVLPVQPINADDFAEDDPAFRRNREYCDRLCGVLDGHAYALQLANWQINDQVARGADPSTVVDHLCANLRQAPPGARASRMVQSCIESVAAVAKRPAEVIAFLERLALFMSPVPDVTVEKCMEHAGIKDTKNFQSELIERLVNSNLVQRVGRKSDASLSLHPVVRGYVFHRLHGADGQDMPNFTLAGLTTGTPAASPGDPRAQRTATDIFDALLVASSEEREDRKKAVGLCRAAFSLMRSRMDAIAASKWERYSRYIERSVLLAKLVKELSAGMMWDYSSASSDELSSHDGVLHAEEFAWLINDLGLACCMEGNMYDTLAVWTYGYEVNQAIERGRVPGQFTVQSQLHLGHAYLDLGDLAKAREYLELTARSNELLGSEDYAGRILGYLGLLEHLSGNTRAAAKFYESADDRLKSYGNSRARSIFIRHWADLDVLLNEMGEARKKVEISLSLAESGHHPDIVASARTTLGHIYRRQRKWSKAYDEYHAALDFAKRMDLRRMEADVHSQLARLAVAQKNAEMARVCAVRALRIANECGLGLRQCHAMVTLGLANDLAGHRKLAADYVRVARRISHSSCYWLRKHEAERILRRWREPFSAPQEREDEVQESHDGGTNR